MGVDFGKLAKELQGVGEQLGETKSAIQDAISGDDSPPAEIKAALDSAEKLQKLLEKKLKSAEVPAEERRRKIAELKSQIDFLKIEQVAEPDFAERIKMGHELVRLNSQLAVWQSQDALTFENLLDAEKVQLKDLLEQAGADISARQHLQRVLNGVGVLLTVAAFAAGVASKLAAAAAAPGP